MADDYVVIEDGQLLNEPSIPVLVLDILRETRANPDADDFNDVADLRKRAQELGADSVVRMCDEWLDEANDARHVLSQPKLGPFEQITSTPSPSGGPQSLHR